MWLVKALPHETLIKWLSQQVGSAHEDDTVGSVIAELNAILIANVQPFFSVLHSDATLTIDVAERVLWRAIANLGYLPRYQFPQTGAGYLPETITVASPLSAPMTDPLGGDEGSVFFLPEPPNPKWAEPSGGRTFAPYTVGSLKFEAARTSDGFLEVTVVGLREPTISCRWPLPKVRHNGLTVGITWNREEIIMYLNGSHVDTIKSS